MKNTGLLLIPALLLVGAAPMHGQGRLEPVRYAIVVTTSSSVSNSKFRIELTRSTKLVRLRYARLDSTQDKRMRQDAEFKRLADSIITGAGTRRGASATSQRQFVALVESYEVYRWDSISLLVAKNQRFVQLLDSVSSASPAQLERTEANRHRLVIDGHSVYLLVKNSQGLIKGVYAHSPRPGSHPLLYRLLHESLEQYRRIRPTALLDVQYTSGY